METMNDNGTVLERVKKVIRWLVAQGYAASQRELAQLMGYKESSLSQILNARVPVSGKFLNRLSAIDRRVSLEWLTTGQGSMLGNNAVELVPASLNDLQEAEFYNTNPKGARFYKKGERWFMTVRHVPYAAFGQFANDSDRLDPDFDEWTEETYEVDRYARGNYLSFEVKGDSMDTGARDSFEAGDRVLVRELERDFWRDPIRFNERPYWVVVFGSSVLIKQMIGQDLREGTLTFHSLNPSPEYADFTLKEDEIRALYYVIKKKPRDVEYIY
jgi:transcriptional regulator with XRE-family HTH domain